MREIAEAKSESPYLAANPPLVSSLDDVAEALNAKRDG
jgi:hypothetical protein